MSHFAVLVVGKDVKAQLAPFQENNMCDCPREFLAFTDKEDEYREEFETETREMVFLADGSRHGKYDERFQLPRGKDFLARQEYGYPEGSEIRAVPFKDIYESIEQFAKDWHGTERDPEKGRFGYWENPNAKWDWYQVGGRWTGFFKAKAGAVASVGSPSLLMKDHRYEAKDADVIRKGDVDWEAMMGPRGEKAASFYDRAAAIIPHHPMLRPWCSIADDESIPNWDDKRRIYREQPVVEALEAAKLGDWDGGYDLERYLEPRDQFILRARRDAVTCFAFLRDGKWAERGEMGWWACVSNEKDKDDWQAQFAALLAAVPDDEILTVVDCHI